MFKNKIIIFFTILFFIISFLLFKHHFSIFYFQNDVSKISINIESENIGDINVCFDMTCDTMEYSKGVYSYELNQQNPLFYANSPKYIEFIVKKPNVKNAFKAISIFYNLDNIFYASSEDISKLEIKEVSFNNEKQYTYEILFNHASDKTILQKFAVYFEGFFYNWYFYLISYALIIIYLTINQNRFNFKIKFEILWIILIGFLLRISHIDYLPLWNDELYTCCFISNIGNSLDLKRTFLDPGNPPLFFMISNFWLLFFNKSTFLIRMLPCLIGIIQIYSAYFIGKKLLDKKTGLIFAFLSSINIIAILESNEIRSYILSMTLILWGIYWFKKLKDNFTIRSLIIYSIFAIALINTHYYCLFFVFSSFILGIFLFKNNRIKFIIANIISGLTFLPYLFKTVLNYSFNAGFNTWIEKPSIAMIHNHIVFYFGNIFWLILIIIFSFWAFKKFQNSEKEIFLFNIYSISAVFTMALMISLLIKPVLFERYFIIFLPLLMLNTSLFLRIDYKKSFKPLILCVILLFSINVPKYENFNLFSNISLMAKYSYLDSKANEKEYKSYYIIPDIYEYIKFFPYIDRQKVLISKYGMLNDEMLVEKLLNDIEDKTSKKILYFPEQTFNFLLRTSTKLNVKKIDTTIMRVYKVYID